jgi:hypothetical protein
VKIFGTLLAQNLWQLVLTLIISKRTVSKICENAQENSLAASWTRSSLTTDILSTTSLFITKICFLFRLSTFYTISLQVRPSLYYSRIKLVHNSRWISSEVMFLAWMKWARLRILQLAE